MSEGWDAGFVKILKHSNSNSEFLKMVKMPLKIQNSNI